MQDARVWHRHNREDSMATFLHVLLIIAIVIVALFVITFVVYFFNLEMKLLAKLEPLFMKHYNKVKRDKHL